MTDRETILAYRMRQTEETLSEAVRMLEAGFSPRSIVNIQNYRDFADAYNNRGITYVISGNRQEGCRSIERACDLGSCTVYDLAKRLDNCL